jgi:asparagine synthase (glutamine-hydrolysing)
MCGIAGYVDFVHMQTQEIGMKMLEKLTPRGPDEEGVYLSPCACLVHRRLTIIDPAGGKQPMSLQAGKTYTLVYNGELYNTEELRSELISLGHTFQGHSDTEVLLHGLAEWGRDCLPRLNGIFAFALWNEQTKTLLLARDPMGVKPLFFSVTPSGFVFASELKAMLCHPDVPPEVDEEGLNQLFFLGPAKTPGSGVFHRISEILPGQWGQYSPDGYRDGFYWKLKAQEHTDNLNQTLEKTRFLLEDAGRRQLVSDVPLCCFLSGGLDSSLLSMLAAKEYAKEGRTLTTFSVDYQDNAQYFRKSLFQPNSDSAYISQMAEFLHSDHRQVILDNTQLFAALPDAVKARDLPGMADIDSSLLLFCREIRRDFAVAVSGECADELFGGYPWYHRREILFADTFPWSRSLTLRRNVLKPGLLPHGEEYVRQQYLDTIALADKLPGESAEDSRMREMFVLNLRWFMQTLLDRKDRMSMACGLEVRVPFCDKRITEYAYNMPWHFKALGGREKGIVRQAFADALPEEIVWRKKSPYPKTWNPIYLELTRCALRKVLADETSPLSPFLNTEFLNGLLEDPASITEPWYGQLMQAPQIFAYLVQLDCWMREYQVKIV